MEVVPLVSVFCPTYNHEKYIRKCLDGFVSQNTNFQIEVIVQDDASTDNTSSIIKEYSDNYPFIIHRLHEFNIFSLGKNLNEYFYKNARGKYLAMCEGDDYWTDPYKLQKQVDFLEANPDYVMCFHDVKILEPNGELKIDYITKIPENYETIITLAEKGNYIHTPSVVFRNIITKFPEEFYQSPIGDYFIHMLMAQQGKIKYLPDNMAVYRNNVGIWSSKDLLYKKIYTHFTFLLLHNYFLERHPSVAKIFKLRIRKFLQLNIHSLSREALHVFTENKENAQIFNEILWEVLEETKKETISQKSIINLLYEIIYRVKRRVKNKLFKV